MSFSPDGRSLAVGNEDFQVELWDIASRTKITLPVVSRTSQVWATQFSPNGRLLAVRRRSEIELWDNMRLTLKTRIKVGGLLEKPIAFSPDSRMLAISSENAGVTLYDTASHSKSKILKGHNGEVTSIAFSPDGKRLATASQDRTAKLWDLASNRTLLTLSGHSVGLNSVAFSSDGRTLVTGDDSGVVRLWHAAMSKEVAEKEPSRAAIQ